MLPHCSIQGESECAAPGQASHLAPGPLSLPPHTTPSASSLRRCAGAGSRPLSGQRADGPPRRPLTARSYRRGRSPPQGIELSRYLSEERDKIRSETNAALLAASGKLESSVSLLSEKLDKSVSLLSEKLDKSVSLLSEKDTQLGNQLSSIDGSIKILGVLGGAVSFVMYFRNL